VSRYGAWIGGAIGWALGGPIGGILGYTFGKMFADNSLSVESNDNWNGNRQTRPGDFSLALLVLSAAVMKADDRVLKSELDFVKAFLKNNFGPNQADQLTLMLRDVLKQEIRVKEVSEQIRHHMDLSKRLLLIQYLYGIAKADGEIHSSEIHQIHQIAGWLRIPAGDLKSIEEMFSAGTSNPFKVLEITKDATDSEVKKAYRKLAVKYHPDKVLDLGESHRKQARERFDAIQNAYEQIKRERGFK
jgi:DnaJ like chaperone protein